MKLIFLLLVLSPLNNSVYYSQTDTSERIVDFPDIEAEIIGGIAALKNQLIELISYPESIIDMNECSRIHLTFTIEKNGTASEITQRKNQCCTSLDSKVVTSLLGKKLFHPAYLSDKPVRTKIVIPITICFTGN